MTTSARRKIYIIDGSRFSTLVEAAAEFTQVLGLAMPWNGNLDALNDFLHGGFGTPDEGFILIWQQSNISRQRLGYEETLRWLEERLCNAHPDSTASFQKRINLARCGEGETLFDMFVQIIRDHDNLELRLE